MKSKTNYLSPKINSGFFVDIRAEKGDEIQFPPLNASVIEVKNYFRRFNPQAIGKIYEQKCVMFVQNKYEIRNLPVGTMLVLEKEGYYRPARISGEDHIDGILLEKVFSNEQNKKLLICTKGVLCAYKIAEANEIIPPVWRRKNPRENMRTYSLFFKKANEEESFLDLLYTAGFEVSFPYVSYAEMLKDLSLRYKLEDYYNPTRN